MTLLRFGLGAFSVFTVPFVVILGFVFFPPSADPASLRQTDVIVVLGGSMYSDGRLGPETEARVKRGVALWKAGLAPRIHMTGGGNNGNNGASTGLAMEVLARALGVPADAVTHEGLSQSTLQNALFSRPDIADAQSLRLVTDAFHLPRAWASFMAMGYRDLSLSHAHALVPDRTRPLYTARILLREWLAWWFNALRFTVWAVAGKLDIQTEAVRDAWLA